MDLKYMDLAFMEAEKAFKIGEVPVGAVIVKNGKVLAKTHNIKEKSKCSINHAEILAILKASKKLKNWRLDGCDIYVTLEPCPMCASAIKQSRIKNVYSALSNKDKIMKLLLKKFLIQIPLILLWNFLIIYLWIKVKHYYKNSFQVKEKSNNVFFFML